MTHTIYMFVIGFLAAMALYGFVFTILFLFRENLGKVQNKIESTKKRKISKAVIIITSTFITLTAVTMAGFWFYENRKEHQWDYIATFKNTGTIDKDSKVLYRGVDVGDITDLTISKDSMYAIIKFRVTQKKIRFLEGSTASKNGNGILNNDDLIIEPPFNPKGRNFLKKGAIIKSDPFNTSEEMHKMATILFKQGKLTAMINDLASTMHNLNVLTTDLNSKDNSGKQDLKTLLKTSNSLFTSLQKTTDNLNTLIGDKNAINDLKKTIQNTNTTIQSVNSMVNKSEGLIESSKNTVDVLHKTATKIHENDTATNVDKSIEKISVILTDLQTITGDETFKEEFKSSIKNANETMTLLNCFTQNASTTLSKRFLIPRMILGKPAAELNKCNPNQTIENSSSTP